jgi:transposase
MLIVFFDAEGAIHREFVSERQKVNAEFYVGVLGRLLKRIRRVRTAKFQSGEWFLFRDNAPSHNGAIVKQFLANRNVAVLHHPPYSPDLAPADYFLFPKFKFPLKERHFQTVEEIQCAVTRELKKKKKTAFLEGMKKLKERANRCIDQGDMYCILKNKNKLCPYRKLSVFYNTCLKTFGSHLVCKQLLSRKHL